MADGSITHYLHQLVANHDEAAEELWGAYWARLVHLARQKLEHAPRRVADEEDVALSAFKSFCVAARAGRFSRLRDRNDLWPLLVAITSHKAIDHMRREGRQKRGGGRVAEFVPTEDDPAPLERLIGREPTPEFALEVAEQCSRLLDMLDDDTLRTVANYRLEGYSVEEIGERLECVPRTVKRKLRRIRTIWGEEVGDESDDV